MFVRFGNILMIVALLATTGGHWLALQSVAWTTMFAENLHSDSFSEALTKTFDGKHLCPLCKAIAAGKKSQKKAEFALQLKKMEFPPVADKIVLFAPAEFELLRLTDISAESLSYQPPTPPPRFV